MSIFIKPCERKKLSIELYIKNNYRKKKNEILVLAPVDKEPGCLHSHPVTRKTGQTEI